MHFFSRQSFSKQLYFNAILHAFKFCVAEYLNISEYFCAVVGSRISPPHEKEGNDNYCMA